MRRLLPALPLLAFAWASTSCAPSGFADPTQIETVRVLASSADKPYAAPGDTVTLDVLAFDGRTTKPEPMKVYWLPLVCENPTDDAYYACFQQFARAAQAGDAGGAGGDAGAPAPGGPFALPTGTSFSFTMPKDAVTAHPAVPGTPVPYGLAIVFNIACAGHVQLVPIDPSNQNPQAVPVGCFDAAGNQLGPDDWVLGFTRVYAYDKVRNANPVISYVDVAGKHLPVAPQPGAPQIYTAPACSSPQGCLSMPACASSKSGDCDVKLGPSVPDSSWEVNPEQTDVNGKPLHEEIWVDYYTSLGQVQDEARLLYDTTSGSVGGPDKTDNTFAAPDTAGTGDLWMVVHDNRGGTSWVTVPMQVCAAGAAHCP